MRGAAPGEMATMVEHDAAFWAKEMRPASGVTHLVGRRWPGGGVRAVFTTLPGRKGHDRQELKMEPGRSRQCDAVLDFWRDHLILTGADDDSRIAPSLIEKLSFGDDDAAPSPRGQLVCRQQYGRNAALVQVGARPHDANPFGDLVEVAAGAGDCRADIRRSALAAVRPRGQTVPLTDVFVMPARKLGELVAQQVSMQADDRAFHRSLSLVRSVE